MPQSLLNPDAHCIANLDPIARAFSYLASEQVTCHSNPDSTHLARGEGFRLLAGRSPWS